MSVETKITTIKENQPKVYDAAVRKYALKTTSEVSDFVSVSNSAAYKILDMGMDGKTEQVTIDGNQLFDLASSEGFVSPYSGLSTEIDMDTNTLTTTNSHTGDRTGNLDLGVLDAGTYYISFENVGGYTTSANISYGEMSSLTRIVSISATGGSFTLNEPLHCWVVWGIKPGTPMILKNIMLNKGSTTLPWEPYVGGQPSPNPVYPQEIVNGGKVGKNLFDENKLSNGEFVEFNGTRCYKYVDGMKHFIYRDIFNVSTQYTITCNAYRENGMTYTIRLTIVYSDGSSKQTIIKPGEITTVTSEEGKTIDYISGVDNYRQAVYLDLSVIQIEEGPVATDYEPHCYKVECTAIGKNLLNSETVELVTNNAYWHRNDPLLLRANTPFTLTVNNVPSNATISLIHFNTTDDVTLKGAYQTNKLSFTLTEDTYGYFRMTFGGVGSDLSFLDECTVQLEIDTVATEHLMHQSSKFTLTSTQPISKWDKLVKRDGVWGWSINSVNRQLTGKVTDWNLTAGWTQFVDSPEGIYTYQITLNDKLWAFDNVYCTTYKLISKAYGAHDAVLYSCSGIISGGRIFFNTDVPTINEWTALLDENPLDVWYQTAEEQAFIPLSEKEQELLNNLETYYGGTNMYNDQGCPMWIKYIVDPGLLK